MRNLIWFLPLLALVLIGLNGSLLQANEENPFQNRVNLALRQTGHTLLLAQGDSTTAIAPVQYNEGAGFLLPLHSPFLYAQLPTFLAEAFADYNITEPYELIVKSCDEDLNLLGFNRKAVESGNVPCIDRTHLLPCAQIYVQFPQREAALAPPPIWPYGLLLVLLGIVGWLVLKRKPTPTPTSSSQKTGLSIGSFLFDPENQTLTLGSEAQTLTFREAKLLRLFAQNPNEILQRDRIQAEVWEDEGVIVGRSLDVFVSRLRKLLKEDSGVQIKNIRGVGYRLEVPM